MSSVSTITSTLKPDRGRPDRSLAASITQAASQQTYYTVRFLVDRDLVPDAYRAYGYFRWMDDRLDQSGMERPERMTFVERQRALVDQCYRGDWSSSEDDLRPSKDDLRHQLTREEDMLVDLIRGDRQKNSGLQAYIRNMLAVMAFDAERRGRLISHEELTRYTRCLAVAVTEALHYFIGHGGRSPHHETRYLAATAAHITHMLRDTLEDAGAGYFNIPREYLEAHGIDPCDVGSDPYQQWVQARVQLARAYFKAGMGYLAQVENPRCRLAGYAYVARFDGVLEAIERDGYRLRAEYPECKRLGAAMRSLGSVLSLAFDHRRLATLSRALPTG